MEDGIMREVVMESEESNEHGLPPGFRFHPTDEELISFYLASKVFNGTALSTFPDVDLNRCEPWELPEVAKMGEREWYFFSLRDRKYPTGLRTNRATGAGYWKATGKDREVGSHLLGLKKTLVFYKGRAPRGLKTKWVMHEYRLLNRQPCTSHNKEEWVMCRIYHKAAVGDKTKFPLLLQERGINGYSNSNNYNMDAAAADLPPLLENEGQTSLLSFQDPCPYPSTESMFLKSLLSQQPAADSLWDLLKGQSSSSSNNNTATSHVLKQCKTEAADSSSTMHHWVDPYQNQSLLFNNNNNNVINVLHDFSSPIFGFPPTSDHHHHDHYYLSNSSSSSFAFNKTPPCFPLNIATLLDP